MTLPDLHLSFQAYCLLLILPLVAVCVIADVVRAFTPTAYWQSEPDRARSWLLGQSRRLMAWRARQRDSPSLARAMLNDVDALDRMTRTQPAPRFCASRTGASASGDRAPGQSWSQSSLET